MLKTPFANKVAIVTVASFDGLACDIPLKDDFRRGDADKDLALTAIPQTICLRAILSHIPSCNSGCPRFKFLAVRLNELCRSLNDSERERGLLIIDADHHLRFA